MELKDFPAAVNGLSNSSDNILLLQGVHKDLEERRLAGSARHGKKVGLGDLILVPPISLAARNRSFTYVTKKLWNQEHMYSHLCLCYSTRN